jgi:hypothetical protein
LIQLRGGSTHKEKIPVLTAEEAAELLDAIDVSTPAGLRVYSTGR